MAFWGFLYRWAVGTWAGALLAFGAVFAPALFRVFTPPEAGSVVRQVIPVLDAAGLVALLLALVSAWRLEGFASRRARWTAALLLLAALCVGISAGLVTPRMTALRESAGDRISELPREHPTRRAFGQLHGVSSGLMLLEWLLATAALALAPHGRAGAPKGRA